ncbi:putative deoxynucleoside triphosphate triphosphohydrolase SAMHD1-like, partial [Apostichopus japonicus]
DVPTENVTSSPERIDSGTEDDQLLQGTKVFNDSVHGHIEIHPLLVSIIDTPEFQRLRFIKQMGMCYFVYPGASHNRFEHSLGVSYLAGKLARSLQSKQKSLKITKEDILCVEIAGLCHDLGHGPFSHLFDEAFLPKVRPKYKGKVKALRTYTPREGTELPIIKDELLTILKGENQEGFLEVVDEREKKGMVSKEMVEEIWSSRKKDKSYLYEIVANKRNGIDVDKWDYFARDSMHLGIQNNFDWKRYLRFARVLHGPDGSQICTRDKEITNLYEMFHSRYSLHLRACNHRVNKILEAMIVEALIEADKYLQFPGKDGIMKTMSQSIDDMEAYSKLNDHIMWTILCSNDDNLKKSRDLINRILTRDLFVCVGQTQLKKKGSQLFNIKEEDAEKEIFEKLSEEAKKTIKQSDIIVHIAKFNYGMGEKDPVEHVKFYSKCDPNKSVRISEIRQDSMALPREFSERFLRVCVKQRDNEVCRWVREAFKKWCKGKELTAKKPWFEEKKKTKPKSVT